MTSEASREGSRGRTRLFWNDRVGAATARYISAIALSLIACWVIAATQGVSGPDLQDVLRQSLFTTSGLLDNVRGATPEILSGCAFAIAARAGIFNLGLEGQFYWGGLAAAIAGIYLPLPGYLSIPLALAFGSVAGAAWAWPAAAMRRRLGINELVTTLMGNYIAVLLTAWIVKTWFLGEGYVIASLPVRQSAQLAVISPISDANLSFSFALLIPAVLAFVLARTSFGFSLRALSNSVSFALYSGVHVERDRTTAFLISGAWPGSSARRRFSGCNTAI